MTTLTALASGGAAHAGLAHLSLAVLMCVPVAVVLGMRPGRDARFRVAALVGMLAGTASLSLAVATGRAMGAEGSGSAGLERHIELAAAARIGLAALTLVYGAALLGAAVVKRPIARRTSLTANIAFLAAYAAAGVLVVGAWVQGRQVAAERQETVPGAAVTLPVQR
jgi:hypothetical protein